jgi:hypothetical protein
MATWRTNAPKWKPRADNLIGSALPHNPVGWLTLPVTVAAVRVG